MVKRHRSSGADSSSGGGSGSATATPYSGSIYGSGGSAAGYPGYPNQGPMASQYYTTSSTPYSTTYNAYPFTPNYSMNPSSAASYQPRAAATPSNYYNSPSSYSAAPGQSGYPAGYGSGAGAGQYMRSAGQGYGGQGAEYSQRSGSGQGYPANYGSGTSLPSLSSSTSMSNPGSTPHLAPISSAETGQQAQAQGQMAGQADYKYGGGGYAYNAPPNAHQSQHGQ